MFNFIFKSITSRYFRCNLPSKILHVMLQWGLNSLQFIISTHWDFSLFTNNFKRRPFRERDINVYVMGTSFLLIFVTKQLILRLVTVQRKKKKLFLYFEETLVYQLEVSQMGFSWTDYELGLAYSFEMKELYYN